MTAHDASPITRHEFNTAMRHLESVLQQQTAILQALAVSAVENKSRDEKITALVAEMAALRKEQSEQKQKLAWATGAGAVLVAAWPLVAKRLGWG